jgi:hypothetical protein
VTIAFEERDASLVERGTGVNTVILLDGSDEA